MNLWALSLQSITGNKPYLAFMLVGARNSVLRSFNRLRSLFRASAFMVKLNVTIPILSDRRESCSHHSCAVA